MVRYHDSALEEIAHDEITLAQGDDTDVSVGAEPDDHLLVAYGFASPTPSEDQVISKSVMWDNAAGEQVVRFTVDTASSDPIINYTVYRVG